MSTCDRPFTVLSSQYLWQSRWYNVRQDHLSGADIADFVYTVIESPGAIWVVPLTADGHLVLVNQYRYPIDQWCLEVPAGNIEPGFSPQEMAVRELHEEIGGTAARIVPVNTFFTMNGIGTEQAHVFAALGVKLGPPAREPTEIMELVQVPLEKGVRMARTGLIKDGPSALAILLSESVLRTGIME